MHMIEEVAQWLAWEDPMMRMTELPTGEIAIHIVGADIWANVVLEPAMVAVLFRRMWQVREAA